MRQFNVTGMSCAACSARVERAVNKVDGVTMCSVSLLTNSMGVEGGSSEDIIRAVEEAGYGCSEKGLPKGKGSFGDDLASLEDRETPVLKKRLFVSLGFLIVLMYFSMGVKMLDWPLPAFLSESLLLQSLVQMMLAVIVMIINQKFFVSGFKALFSGAPNMDTLVALGSAASFSYSFALFCLMLSAAEGGSGELAFYAHDLYFESAAMIPTLITVGKMLEARSKGKTTDALKGLIKLAPETAFVIREGIETEIPVDQVLAGDVFSVRPGQTVPVDGVVIEGSSSVNESFLTGESMPILKEEGSLVSAASVNQSGYIKCRATRVGEDTTLSQIIRLVSDAAATKAPIAKTADKVSGVFVPVVMGLAVLVTLIWCLAGQTFGYALARGISVLVISCPCALGLATPVAIMVGSGMGAKKGILFKTAVSLENTGKAVIAALDKTGTVTTGEPAVTDIVPVFGKDEKYLLTIACALEEKSEHPLAGAVLEEGKKQGIRVPGVSGFEVLPGLGLRAEFEGKSLAGGNLRYISTVCSVPDSVVSQAASFADEGKTPLFFAENGEFIGIIAAADVLRDDSVQAIKALKKLGLYVVLLTGDSERTARAIGQSCGADKVIAEVLPGEKEKVISLLRERGQVIMVGDGINDAPALTAAHTGIAVGAGADIAIDSADIVLMNSRLSDVCAAIRLSRATLKNIRQNLFWAFFYNAVCIPVAAGVFAVRGLTLNPMIGAAAMACSSFFVVTNALRLNLFDMHDPSGDRPLKGSVQLDISDFGTKERKMESMEKIIKIEGMMCGHCEKAVKTALEKLDGVMSAAADHNTGLCTVVLSGSVDDDILKKTVEAEDFKVIDIK